MGLKRAQIRSLDPFQFYLLRRCLGIPPTHVDREVPNRRVMELAEEARGKAVPLFSFIYKYARIKLLGHIIRAGPEDPLRMVTFDEGIAPPPYRKYRVGRPRYNWLEEVYRDLAHIIPMEYSLEPGSEFLQLVEELATGREGPFEQKDITSLYEDARGQELNLIENY